MRWFKDYVIKNVNSKKELVSLTTLELTSQPDKNGFKKWQSSHNYTQCITDYNFVSYFSEVVKHKSISFYNYEGCRCLLQYQNSIKFHIFQSNNYTTDKKEGRGTNKEAGLWERFLCFTLHMFIESSVSEKFSGKRVL